ncbi:unnamed protein product [Periconia digitata]|uniref:Uncharacterized protein n=1 Tax=Periconia digitata TaxID=1303443 RepID=A0A9W4U3Z6_9PLEO|nr:unnamed protein product [Periconia digitata]
MIPFSIFKSINFSRRLPCLLRVLPLVLWTRPAHLHPSHASWNPSIISLPCNHLSTLAYMYAMPCTFSSSLEHSPSPHVYMHTQMQNTIRHVVQCSPLSLHSSRESRNIHRPAINTPGQTRPSPH